MIQRIFDMVYNELIGANTLGSMFRIDDLALIITYFIFFGLLVLMVYIFKFFIRIWIW